MSDRDRALCMNSPITRRDIINGVAVVVTGSLLPSTARTFAKHPTEIAAERGYPPALTGLRGSHDGSWEVAHLMRHTSSWDEVGTEADTCELN